MKHLILSIFTLATICLALPCQAYDFSDVSPSGHTLYYNIVNGEAQVTRPSTTGYGGSIAGHLIIPDSVSYLMHTYAVTSIDERAFQGCQNMTQVSCPNTITTINRLAFFNCPYLTSVTLPDSLTIIDERIFTFCDNLTSITIPNTVTSIGMLAFSGCSSLANITIPNSVRYICNNAFINCTSLTSIIIPNSVSYIDKPFVGCYNIDTIIVLPGNPYFDSRNGCNAIIETYTNNLVVGCKSTIIPNSVTIIDQSAFENHSTLTSIAIPSSVTTIYQSAFFGCPLDTVFLFWETPISADVTGGLLSLNRVFSIPCGTTSNYANTWNNALYSFNFEERGLDFQLDVSASEYDWGTVSIIPQDGYNIRCSDSTAIIQAIASDGYQFSHWDNGNVANPDTLRIHSDSSVTAIFVPAVGVENPVMDELLVYARNGQLFVSGDCNIKDVEIYDISGKLLKTVRIEGNSAVIDIARFASGIYVVRANTSNGPVTRKVVK